MRPPASCAALPCPANHAPSITRLGPSGTLPPSPVCAAPPALLGGCWVPVLRGSKAEASGPWSSISTGKWAPARASKAGGIARSVLTMPALGSLLPTRLQRVPSSALRSPRSPGCRSRGARLRGGRCYNPGSRHSGENRGRRELAPGKTAKCPWRGGTRLGTFTTGHTRRGGGLVWARGDTLVWHHDEARAAVLLPGLAEKQEKPAPSDAWKQPRRQLPAAASLPRPCQLWRRPCHQQGTQRGRSVLVQTPSRPYPPAGRAKHAFSPALSP